MKTTIKVEVEYSLTSDEAFAAGVAYTVVSQALTDCSLPEGCSIESVTVFKPMPVIVVEDPPPPPPPEYTGGEEDIPF